VRKGAIAQNVEPFIQNVHHFRDEGLCSGEPPIDHVVVFDEAQRAWNRSKTARFMSRMRVEGPAANRSLAHPQTRGEHARPCPREKINPAMPSGQPAAS
jgi:hypothetical protein